MLKRSVLQTRKSAIQELINKHAIEDQATLQELLKQEYLIETNQAAISRDLRDLGIYKRARGDKLVYELPEIDPITEMLQYAVQSVQHNESMIVVHTMPGTAAFVADVIDGHHDPDILGTLAGENIVFIVPRSTAIITSVTATVRKQVKMKEE